MSSSRDSSSTPCHRYLAPSLILSLPAIRLFDVCFNVRYYHIWMCDCISPSTRARVAIVASTPPMFPATTSKTYHSSLDQDCLSLLILIDCGIDIDYGIDPEWGTDIDCDMRILFP